jgi:hypothetical protein
MVHYKIYNKPVDLPLDVFCTAIRVPQWGSLEKIRGQPRQLLNYTRRFVKEEASHEKEWMVATEDELDAYIGEHPPPVHDEEGTEESGQPSDTMNFPYEQPYYDYAPSASSSREPEYDYSYDDPPAWSSYQSQH